VSFFSKPTSPPVSLTSNSPASSKRLPHQSSIPLLHRHLSQLTGCFPTAQKYTQPPHIQSLNLPLAMSSFCPNLPSPLLILPSQKMVHTCSSLLAHQPLRPACCTLISGSCSYLKDLIGKSSGPFSDLTADSHCCIECYPSGTLSFGSLDSPHTSCLLLCLQGSVVVSFHDGVHLAWSHPTLYQGWRIWWK
jgi:hypothetical protein